MAGDARTDFDSPTNPIKAIRLKCRDCANNQYTEIDNCAVKSCPLFPFRFGKNPFRKKRVLSSNLRSEVQSRLEKARQQKAASLAAKKVSTKSASNTTARTKFRSESVYGSSESSPRSSARTGDSPEEELA